MSSINKSNNSNNSSSSLPITENKKVINNSAINNNNHNISNQNISLEIEDKNNLTTTIINKGIIEIPKVINQTLENNYNNYNNSLKAKFKKSLNKSLFYLKSKYNFLKPYTSQGFDSKKKNFQNDLLELQNFKADSEQIWVASLDKNHNYLATGGKSGVVKIWKMNTIQDDDNKYNNSILFFNNKDLKSDEEIKHFLNIIDETAYKLYCEHSLDVIDLAWSKKYEYLLVSVSLDKKAVLYDINQNSPINIFFHKSAITSISFYPDKLLLINIYINDRNNYACFTDENKKDISAPQKKDDFFITSSFDSKVYIWNIHNNKDPFYCIYVNENITKALFFPDGSRLCLGSIYGNIFIYEVIENFRYSYSFHVRNKKGKGSMDRKITDMKFLTKTQILVTTNDDRIRILNINNGDVIQKFRGHKNTEGMLKADYCENYELIISPSEDKYVYLWNIKKSKKKVDKPEKATKKLNQKIHNYEYFKPNYLERKEYCTQCLFIEGQNLIDYNHKIYNNELFIYIKNIIMLTTNKGNIQVILDYNILEDKKK